MGLSFWFVTVETGRLLHGKSDRSMYILIHMVAAFYVFL